LRTRDVPTYLLCFVPSSSRCGLLLLPLPFFVPFVLPFFLLSSSLSPPSSPSQALLDYTPEISELIYFPLQKSRQHQQLFERREKARRKEERAGGRKEGWSRERREERNGIGEGEKEEEERGAKRRRTSSLPLPEEEGGEITEFLGMEGEEREYARVLKKILQKSRYILPSLPLPSPLSPLPFPLSPLPSPLPSPFSENT
jgi:hypothetical protein